MVDKLTDNFIKEYKAYLIEDEKSAATIEKYMRSVMHFAAFVGERKLTKTLVIEYRDKLLADSYSERSVNAILAGINSLLHHIHFTKTDDKAIAEVLFTIILKRPNVYSEMNLKIHQH